jgi:hypothetical protein
LSIKRRTTEEPRPWSWCSYYANSRAGISFDALILDGFDAVRKVFARVVAVVGTMGMMDMMDMIEHDVYVGTNHQPEEETTAGRMWNIASR